LAFFHIVNIISLFNLLFFRIFHIFSLFNLLFSHIFNIISLEIMVITKLPNSEQSSKEKVKTYKYQNWTWIVLRIIIWKIVALCEIYMENQKRSNTEYFFLNCRVIWNYIEKNGSFRILLSNVCSLCTIALLEHPTSNLIYFIRNTIQWQYFCRQIIKSCSNHGDLKYMLLRKTYFN
jgi:hypothetical protein